MGSKNKKEKVEVIITRDGSHTVSIPGKQVMYHSIHGAIQESMHVFIEAGFRSYIKKHDPVAVRIFEMGFGTGLNALLTFRENEFGSIKVEYHAVDIQPLDIEVTQQLNYTATLGRPDLQSIFEKLHTSEWGERVELSPNFFLEKNDSDIGAMDLPDKLDVIYFDAFAPAAQPELWTAEIFSKLFSKMNKNGMLVTYCSKGDVRRVLSDVGFNVEKLAGPPGKREMLRAVKLG